MCVLTIPSAAFILLLLIHMSLSLNNTNDGLACFGILDKYRQVTCFLCGMSVLELCRLRVGALDHSLSWMYGLPLSEQVTTYLSTVPLTDI